MALSYSERRSRGQGQRPNLYHSCYKLITVINQVKGMVESGHANVKHGRIRAR